MFEIRVRPQLKNYYKLHPKNIIDFFTHNNSHGNNVDRIKFVLDFFTRMILLNRYFTEFYFYVEQQTMALVKSPPTIRNLVISVHKHPIKDAPDEEAPQH